MSNIEHQGLLKRKTNRKKLKLSKSTNLISQSPQTKNIKYDIDSWSSFISYFHPKNILIEGGQLSKWSVDFKSKKEYLYLKLNKTSIVQIVTFGKYRDPTNLKEFRLFAGLDKDNMIEILHSGLNYDNDYESFTVYHKWNNKFIPAK